MTNAPDLEPHTIPDPWQPRFGIFGLFLVTLVFCVMAASGYYLVQAQDATHTVRLKFVLFVCACPIILVAVVSLIRRAVLWYSDFTARMGRDDDATKDEKSSI